MSRTTYHRPPFSMIAPTSRVPARPLAEDTRSAWQPRVRDGATSGPRVLLVDDHALLADSLAIMLESAGIAATGVAAESVDQVLREARARRVDVVFLDLDLGAFGSGRELVAPLAALGPRVVMLTAGVDELLIAQCVERGAVGVVHKRASFLELVAAVHDVVRCGALFGQQERDAFLSLLDRDRTARSTASRLLDTLTRREGEILALLMDGRSAHEIAKEQWVSINTVRSHIRSVLTKLGVHSQVAAVALARRAGWELDAGVPQRK